MYQVDSTNVVTVSELFRVSQTPTSIRGLDVQCLQQMLEAPLLRWFPPSLVLGVAHLKLGCLGTARLGGCVCP